MMGSNSLQIQIPISLANHTPLHSSLPQLPLSLQRRRFHPRLLAIHLRRGSVLAFSAAGVANSVPRNGNYTVGDFMTTKEHLHVVRPSTTVDQALDFLVEKRITGFPVVDDDWKLVGVVSDYDLLALDSISGGIQGGASQHDTNLFPDVDSSWKLWLSLLFLSLVHHDTPDRPLGEGGSTQEQSTQTEAKKRSWNCCVEFTTPPPFQ